ncbi:MAG TPA: DUF3617 family protein [Allosphingosinicella sp.]|uniref:DUF3617 domain-containing protein n=1 Tax=Allosphingosinicella sp. TaxID=2823234 RepID=UPI002ED77EBD
MMRMIAIASLLALAACSEDAGADHKAKAAADAANLKLAAGQWETVVEITQVDSQDNGTPVLKTGKTTYSGCVAEADGKKPPAAVLAGMDDCSYNTVYMSRGRVNASISCTRPGLAGKISMSNEGSYTADSFELNSSIQTYLTSDGDVKAAAKVTGRRTGDCTAAAPKAA